MTVVDEAWISQCRNAARLVGDAGMWGTADLINEMIDALVAAVRDADIIRQAREMAETVDKGYTSADNEWWSALEDLLDLLSPAPQGEGT